MESSLAGGRRSYHQQNQPKCRSKGNTYSNGAPLFLHFPPPPNYPPSYDKYCYEDKGGKKMHRCPNDLDRIEICLEPEQMLSLSSSSSPMQPYNKSGDGAGGRNGIRKFQNNAELQNSSYPNISATMERFEPSTSSSRKKQQSCNQHMIHHTLPTYDPAIEISHSIPLLDSIAAGPSRTPTPNSMHALTTTMNRQSNGLISSRSRHMYTTHYGTQENIYEDIEAEQRLRILNGGQSMISLQQSNVEEEFRRVETRHRRVLAELNLSTEAMLMPSDPPCQVSTDEEYVNSQNITELLQAVELNEELLSPVSNNAVGIGDMDSGFSGSSSGASCIGSIRFRAGTFPTRPPTPIDPCNVSIYCNSHRSNGDSSFVTYSSRSRLTFGSDKLEHSMSDESAKSKNSFWSRKRWRKLPGLLGSSTQKSSIENDEHKLNAGVWEDSLPVPNTPKLNQQHRHNNDIRQQQQPQSPFITLDLHSNKNINNNHLASNHIGQTQQYQLNHNNSTANSRRLEHNSSTRTNSSEESCWSERCTSDHDLSSDGEDESDRSVTSTNIRNSNLRSTLNKAKHHLDKWRGSNSSQLSTGNVSMQSQTEVPSPGEPSGGRLSRWFSIRRGSSHHYDIGGKDGRTGNLEKENKLPATKTVKANSSGNQMPQLAETEEDSTLYGREFIGDRNNGTLRSTRRHGSCLITPTLPPTPAGLSHQQLKRRHIVAAIIHSENSYVATLQRLCNDYKKPLETSTPPILSSSKISTLFHRLPEILQCHTLFRIALADCVRNWDRDERLGDVFVGSFGKPVVLDIYSGFINNFSAAMDLAKMEAKRKSALADFFKVKQISAHDRLSFFGLMVKPVQRFPQFILFLQDLLKNIPPDHHDRMSLQLALTQLESLAEMLNERKREAEQYQAFKEMLGHISGTFNTRSLSSTGNRNRYLLREDNLTQIEFNQSGFIVKSKQRRLLLLNDKVICVSVAPRQSQDFGATEKLTFKWIFPVTDVDIVDNSTTSTSLSRILTAGMNRGGSLKSNNSNSGTGDSPSTINGADNLCNEMSILMHDYEVVSRVNDLVGILKCPYKELNSDVTKHLLTTIQSSIQKKDEEMAWVDSCCLQLVAKNKNGKEETFTFQADKPSVKKEWITELRLAQLALDANNSPAWEVPEHEQRPSTKMPLFVEAQAVAKSHHQTEVRCGCYYSTIKQATAHQRFRCQNYLLVCTIDGTNSRITTLLQNQQRAGKLKEVGSYDLPQTLVTTIEFVKCDIDAKHIIEWDTYWIGTESGRLFIYDANNPEQEKQIAAGNTSSAITQILYHLNSVFVAMANGNLQIFRRGSDSQWNLKTSQTVTLLDTDPVSHILPINETIYAACGRKVWVINGLSGDILKPFDVHHVEGECNQPVNLMAHSGIGLWVSLKSSNIICLYHTETFKHLQDINIASNVLRLTSSGGSVNHKSSIYVTALMACKGLLWVGTNVGISLTIPLPRLEGVPIMSGGVSISYHAHFGPITFMLPLVQKTYFRPTAKLALELQSDASIIENSSTASSDTQKEVEDEMEMEKKMKKQNSLDLPTKIRAQLENSPIMLRRRRLKDANENCRLSKTLPRGVGSMKTHSNANDTTSQHSNESGCDVYGLYGDLIYVKESYESHRDRENLMDPSYENLRRSDPELAAIPGKMSTLDRRLRMKVSRPKSLDLSNWSVESKSSSMYTSSGSEESMAIRHGLYAGRSVSRNSSNASRKTINMTDLMHIKEHEPVATDILSVTTESIDLTDGVANMQFKNSKTSTIKKKKNTGFNEKVNAENSGRQTVITLTGGRGYINWRHIWCSSSLDKSKSSNARSLTKVPNSSDAHFIIWEKKV